MQTPDDRITEKFSELMVRYDDYESGKFSRAERAIYFIILIGLDINTCAFACIFQQSLTKSEITEAIGFMQELGLVTEAKLFQETLDMLDRHGFYGNGDRPAIPFKAIPEQIWDWIDEIGEHFWNNDALWSVDEKLCAMLDGE